MMTRSDRIVILAWSLLDAIRQPNIDSSGGGAPEKRVASGGEWKLCDTCQGEGWTVDRYRHPQPCLQCDGAGRYEIDPYTQQRVSTWLSPAPTLVEHHGCAWCQPSHGQEAAGRWDTLPRGTGVRHGERCEFCDGSGWRSLTASDVELELRKRRSGDLVAWTMRGDWPVLTACLERLRRFDRVAHNRFLDEAAAGDIRSEPARRGLAFLEHAMPRRLHVPGAVQEAYDVRSRRAQEWERARQRRLGARARSGRNESIRQLAKAGKHTAEVAAIVGVSERTVRRVM